MTFYKGKNGFPEIRVNDKNPDSPSGPYAHSLKDAPKEKWQLLSEHLVQTAELASKFASPWAPFLAWLIAFVHDIGKASREFQSKLDGEDIRVDHATAAYPCLVKKWDSSDGLCLASFLSYALLGHHGGMANWSDDFIERSLKFRISDEYLEQIPKWDFPVDFPSVKEFFEEIKNIYKDGIPDGFAAAFLLRMLYSCLVDADWLDTERFCSPWRAERRCAPVTLEMLKKRFFKFLRKKGFLSGTNNFRLDGIDAARKYMLRCCIEKGEEKPGFFTLTMPTGGGKTLSSMAFALRHAVKYGLKRVIVVTPYTSIIEQNADVLRDALSDVLEHHGNYVPREGEEKKYQLLSENWDAPVIVTTSVQFFESLFANHSGQCRKLHNIAQSVVILDEVQMLPLGLIDPCLAALKELVRNYGSTVVLCSATQPAVTGDYLKCGVEKVSDIIPDVSEIFRTFERATIEVLEEKIDATALVGLIQKEKQVLCIVNSREFAREIFSLSKGNFHLSSRMTPAHRTRVLKQIRECLSRGIPCRVISTSLIECGVDISFPVVLREKNGLDVLAQSAGRCNREGKSTGRVICFEMSNGGKAPELSRRCMAFDQVSGEKNLFAPETVRKYFEHLYAAHWMRNGQNDFDSKGILEKTKFVRDATYKTCWQFQFAEIAKEFCFIGGNTVNVVIGSEEALDILNSDCSPKKMLRKLQRHSVQVSREELAKLQVEWKYELIPLVMEGYDEKTGLNIE